MSRVIKTGTVVHRQDNPTPRTNSGGTWYDFTVTFDNGDRGEGSGKDGYDQYFVPGAQVDYTLDTSKPKYPKVYKPSKRDLESLPRASSPAQAPPPPAQHAPPAQQPPYAPAPAAPAPPPQQAPYTPPASLVSPAYTNKERNIVRESALGSAIKTYELGGQAVAPSAVLQLAETYEAWIIREKELTGSSINEQPPY